LPGLALNCDPLSLSLSSSWDYRSEPLALAARAFLGAPRVIILKLQQVAASTVGSTPRTWAGLYL
jgi:hypothetical protein